MLKSLTGSLGKMMGGQRADQRNGKAPPSPWTYPDGRPYPVNGKKADVSPLTRPKRLRSSSFNGRGKKEEEYYLFDPYERNEETRLHRWRSLNKPERLPERPKQKRRASEERYTYNRPRNDGYFDDWGGPAKDWNRPRHRRGFSESMDNRPRGVTLDDYIPPERRVQNWFFPDGTPYPKPNEIAHDGVHPGLLAPPTVSGGRLTPRVTPMVNSNPLPRGPSPVPVQSVLHSMAASQPIPSTSAVRLDSMPQPQIPIQPNAPQMNIPHQGHPLLTMTYDPSNETQRGLPDFINPEVTHTFDRSNELCHFSYHGVVYGGKLFPTAYHLWEAMKFVETRPDYVKKIRKTEKPRDVQKLLEEWGPADIRPDWNNVAIQLVSLTSYLS